MIIPDEIIKQNRNSIKLEIKPSGMILVKAPLYISDNDILNFVNQKQDWIIKKQQQVLSNKINNDDIINYKNLLLFGKKIKIIYSDAIKQSKLDGGVALIPKCKTSEECSHKIALLLKKIAKKHLIQRVNQIAKMLKINISSVKIAGSTGRWGSCNNNNQITLNYRAVCLDPAIIDYIIIHELMHTKELNHSANFWKLVYDVMPNYKQLRNELKNLNYLISIY